MRSRGAFMGSIESLTIGGEHHPEHPNRFMESENISEMASVKNVVLVSDHGKMEVIH